MGGELSREGSGSGAGWNRDDEATSESNRKTNKYISNNQPYTSQQNQGTSRSSTFTPPKGYWEKRDADTEDNIRRTKELEASLRSHPSSRKSKASDQIPSPTFEKLEIKPPLTYEIPEAFTQPVTHMYVGHGEKMQKTFITEKEQRRLGRPFPGGCETVISSSKKKNNRVG